MKRRSFVKLLGLTASAPLIDKVAQPLPSNADLDSMIAATRIRNHKHAVTTLSKLEPMVSDNPHGINKIHIGLTDF